MKRKIRCFQKSNRGFCPTRAQALARWDNLPAKQHASLSPTWIIVASGMLGVGCKPLDDDIAHDFSQLGGHIAETMRRWNDIRANVFRWNISFRRNARSLRLRKVCNPSVALSQISFQKATRKIIRSFSTKEISEPVCVDLTVLRPRHATTKVSSTSLGQTYLW